MRQLQRREENKGICHYKQKGRWFHEILFILFPDAAYLKLFEQELTRAAQTLKPLPPQTH